MAMAGAKKINLKIRVPKMAGAKKKSSKVPNPNSGCSFLRMTKPCAMLLV
jgi:hypothetical protein